MVEVSIDTKTQNDLLYEAMNASFGTDGLLYNKLSERLKESGISEESLIKWACYVKLAAPSITKLNELEEFAVIKILRSWKSIQGIIRLGNVG